MWALKNKKTGEFATEVRTLLGELSTDPDYKQECVIVEDCKWDIGVASQYLPNPEDWIPVRVKVVETNE